MAFRDVQPPAAEPSLSRKTDFPNSSYKNFLPGHQVLYSFLQGFAKHGLQGVPTDSIYSSASPPLSSGAGDCREPHGLGRQSL